MKSLIFSSMFINFLMVDGVVGKALRADGGCLKPGAKRGAMVLFRPAPRERGLVKAAQVYRQALDGMIFLNIGSSLRAHPGSKISVADESGKRSHLGVEILATNQKTSFAMFQNFRHAADICRDDWQSGCHRLQQNIGRAFMIGGKDANR